MWAWVELTVLVSSGWWCWELGGVRGVRRGKVPEEGGGAGCGVVASTAAPTFGRAGSQQPRALGATQHA